MQKGEENDKRTLKEARQLDIDIECINKVLKEIETTNIIPNDILMRLDCDTYKILIAIVKETLRDTISYKEKKFAEL